MEAFGSDHVNILESSFDDVMLKALQARDLLTGASALLRGNPSSSLADLIARARAATASIVEVLEQAVTLDRERKRNHAQASKHVGQEVR